ncbi:hypothetical protein BHM03_00008435 [Ensete ventricosum]|uniref:Uncharacterized protein n=1 Tax=Ensete ventricosum TaxID=4639 RepID=A0A445MCH4_ENSVE|nr:hypothetical protein BHM03_00008435 [Ensete ventricosum]
MVRTRGTGLGGGERGSAEKKTRGERLAVDGRCFAWLVNGAHGATTREEKEAIVFRITGCQRRDLVISSLKFTFIGPMLPTDALTGRSMVISTKIIAMTRSVMTSKIISRSSYARDISGAMSRGPEGLPHTPRG